MTRDNPMLTPKGLASRAFVEFWRQRTAAIGRVPARSEILPDDLLAIIDHVWLYERDRDDFRCVVMGNHVQRRWGRAVIGYRFADLMPADRAALLAGRLMGALSRGYVGHGMSDVARSDWYAERVYGPLLGRDGMPQFVLGVSDYVDRSVTAAPGTTAIPLGVTHFYDALSLDFRETQKDD